MNEEGRLKEACRISSRIAESVRQADTKVLLCLDWITSWSGAWRF